MSREEHTESSRMAPAPRLLSILFVVPQDREGTGVQVGMGDSSAECKFKNILICVDSFLICVAIPVF